MRRARVLQCELPVHGGLQHSLREQPPQLQPPPLDTATSETAASDTAPAEKDTVDIHEHTEAEAAEEMAE